MSQQKNTEEDIQPLLTFPCAFPFKVMGLNTTSFEHDFMQMLRRHVPDLGDVTLDKRPSRNGKYVALNITFTASSQHQLDQLYREISAHPETRMVL